MQEPLAATSPRQASADEARLADISPEELEVARLEALLSARTRELGSLRREHARAELTFTLDETRAQLGAAGSVPSAQVGQAGLGEERGDNVSDARAVRGLYARIAELEEAEGAVHARLVLAEQDRDVARNRV